MCFGASVSCIATTAAFSGSFCCLVLVKKRFYFITVWKCGATVTVQRVSQSVCVWLKSGKVCGFRKFWWLDFFLYECQARGCYFPRENCRREKCKLWERQDFLGKADMVPLLSFSWIFCSCLFPLPKQAIKAAPSFPFLRWITAATQACREACYAGQWLLNHWE